jgi:hypothetical protein
MRVILPEPYHSEALWHKTVPVVSRLSFVRARITPFGFLTISWFLRRRPHWRCGLMLVRTGE